MAQAGPDQRVFRQKPASNVYTALLIIATICVTAATVFVIVRSDQLFGSILPP